MFLEKLFRVMCPGRYQRALMFYVRVYVKRFYLLFVVYFKREKLFQEKLFRGMCPSGTGVC